MLSRARAQIGAFRYERAQQARRREARSRQVAFYRSLFTIDDLVFDVGANVGDRSDVFLELGGRVIAYEPLPQLAEELRLRFTGRPELTVRDVALAPHAGTAELHVGDETTISSMSPDWQQAVVTSGRFSQHEWSAPTQVPTSTLDDEIARFGLPSFCKIDVEGFEFEVLRGLSHAVPVLSLEYTHEFAEATNSCLRHLATLGDYEFAFSEGESMALWPLGWTDVHDTLQALQELPGDLPWGDTYARLRTRPSPG